MITDSNCTSQERASESALTKDTLVIGIFTIASNLIALLREVVFASKYGTSAVADAYILSFSVCSAIFLLVSSGNIAYVFIPRVQSLNKASDKNAYYSTVLCISAAAAVLITTVVILNSGGIISLIARGSSEHTSRIAAFILTLIAPIIIFSSIGAVYQAALNSRLSFAGPAAIPVLSNIVFISVLLFANGLSLQAQIAIACLLSYSVWILLYFPASKLYSFSGFSALTKKISYSADFSLSLMPLMLVTGIDQVVFLVQKYSLSFMESGSISAINYAYRLESIPVGLIAAAFSTAIFPRFSNFFSQKDHENLSGIFNYGLEAIILVSVPMTALSIGLAKPIVEVLLMRGSFSNTDVYRVAFSLVIYSIGIVPQVLTVYLSRLVLSASGFRVLLLLAIITSAVFMPLVLVLPRYIGEIGIPAATTVNALIYSLLLLYKAKGYVQIPFKYFTSLVVKSVLAAGSITFFSCLVFSKLTTLLLLPVVSVTTILAYLFIVYNLFPLLYCRSILTRGSIMLKSVFNNAGQN